MSPFLSAMCFTFYLEVDGEREEELGKISCHLSGCGLSTRFFRDMAEDIADTDIRVASERLDSYLDVMLAASRWPSAPSRSRAVGRVAAELDYFAERCGSFSQGIVRTEHPCH